MKLENRASNLHKNLIVLGKLKWFVNKYKGTKLGVFVNNPKIPLAISVLNQLKSGMMPAHTDISDSDLTLGASANLNVRGGAKVNNVDCL